MRKIFARFPPLLSLSVLALLGLLNACAGTPKTHHSAAQPVEIHKLFVLTQLGTENSTAFAAAFAHAITKSMQSCNIEAMVENVPIKDRSLSLGTDPFVAINADMAKYAPDSIMRVDQKATGLLIGTNINVVLIKPIAGGMIWNGAFRTSSDLTDLDGITLAQSITNAMKRDAVAQNCGLPGGNE